MTDHELLQAYAEGSQNAFTQLVECHLPLVWSAACRQMSDAHLAQDVAQQVFTLLAQKAATIGSHIILSGWLYRVTCHVAARAQRGEMRRRQREQSAVTAMNDAPTDSAWLEIEPLLDEAMGSLGQLDRDAVLLRYFENKSLQEVGAALGSSEDAAQKRLSRAVEKLRAFFGKRGKTMTAGSLITAVTLGAIQPAPAALITTISTAALCGAVATTSTAVTLTTLNLMSAATMKSIAVGTAALAASVVIIVQHQGGNRLRHENESLLARVQQAEAASVGTSNRLQADEKPGEPQQRKLQELESEVMRLRGLASRALRAEAEVGQLKSALESRRVSAANSSSNGFLAYLGEAVPPPSNLDPAYTKEGLLNAIQQAAQLAAVPLKKVEIETSEFPFLAGVVCDSDADFEKLKAQVKNMPGYEYGGATGSGGTSAFNITPSRSYPSESAQRIRRRTMLRTQMFFDQLVLH